MLLVLFNVCFVAPLIGIVLVLALSGDSAVASISRTRDRLYAHWPAVLASFAMLIGVFVVTAGVAGLLHHHHRAAQPQKIGTGVSVWIDS